MSVVIDGTSGITTPAETVQGALTTTGNTILGDSSADTLNVGNGGLVKDASGNVGIGTASPAYKLDASGTIRANGGYFRSTITYTVETGADILGTTGGMTSIGANPLVFGTNGTERMRIDSSGNVLVGKTVDGTTAGFEFSPTWWAANVGHALVSGNSTSNSQQALSVYTTASSQYQFYVGYGGTVYARSTSITSLSDISEKENIKDLETGLGTVLALRPRRFDWKNGSGTNIAGFIAQEVESILPDLVESFRVSEDETKLGLKMGDMIPTLVKAIQEQQALITQLQADVATLKALSA